MFVLQLTPALHCLQHHNFVRKMWGWDIDMLGRAAPEGVGNFKMMVQHGNYDDLAARHQTSMNVSSFVDMVRTRVVLRIHIATP